MWGGYLNTDLDSLDTLMKQAITITSAASQTTGFTAAVTISLKTLYPCDATAASFAATLPSASSAGNGGTVYFKKMDSSVNTITITRAGADTIDGATTKILSTQYEVTALASDGVSAWRVVSSIPAVFTGDSGSGGLSGLVPAPASGDGAAFKFLRATGGWAQLFASAAETATGTSTSLAVTPAGLAGTKSLAANGYYKFPGGLMVQWGSTTSNPAGTAVTFPLAFSTAVGAIMITPNEDIGDGCNPPTALSRSVSGFTAKCLDLTIQTDWFAIGY